MQSVRQETPDLTARQMAVMLTVYTGTPPHRVRSLAQSLGVSKPAITRALDKLEQTGFVRRKPDSEDGRSVLIQRTVQGSVFLAEFGELIQRALESELRGRG